MRTVQDQAIKGKTDKNQSKSETNLCQLTKSPEDVPKEAVARNLRRRDTRTLPELCNARSKQIKKQAKN